MGELNAGIFELAGEGVDRAPGDPGLRDYHVRLRDLAVETGRPITFGVFSRRGVPDVWRKYLALLDETAAAGGRMFAQVHSRSLTVLLSFKTQLPFDRLPVWKELRALPARRAAADAARSRAARRAGRGRARARRAPRRRHRGAAADYDWLLRLRHAWTARTARWPRSRASAAQHPAETMIDLALEKDIDAFFLQPIANENQDYALELMRHPRTVMTFSDSGAHVSQLMDSSLQTHLLSHWVRDKQALHARAGRAHAHLRARHAMGLRRPRPDPRGHGRRPRGLRSRHHRGRRCRRWCDDLPAGARRLIQRTRGIAATVVNGEVLLRDGKHTGALPGQLLRGPLARSA